MSAAKPAYPRLRRGLPLANGLILGLPCYEGSGLATRDLSGYENNATLQGGMSWSGGQNGTALKFNGTSGYVSVPNNPAVNAATAAITFGGWYNVTAINGYRMLSNWDGTNGWILQQNGSLSWQAYVKASGGGLLQAHCTLNLTAGWHFVVCTYDGANMRLYVDLQQDGNSTTAQTGTISTNSHAIYLGTNETANGSWFNGEMDGQFVFNRALSFSELAMLFEDAFVIYRRPSWRLKGAANQTLIANFGSYALTGEAATLNPAIVANAGTFALTGENATLNAAIVGSNGSYALTGEGATLNPAIVANAGTFALTGDNATLNAAIVGSNGSYALTGEAATLNPAIVANAGTFALTGENATLNPAIVGSNGSYALTGENAVLGAGLNAGAGTYALTGQPAILGAALVAGTGAYTLTGEPATLTASGSAPAKPPAIYWLPPAGLGQLLYNVRRSPAGQDVWMQIATEIDVPYFIDWQADPTQNWDYQTQALNAAGASPWSRTTTYTPSPDIPFVCWRPLQGAVSYNVRRSPDRTSWTVLATGLAVPYYVDAAADPTQTWYYEAQALSPAGPSPWSGLGTWTP